ncbi:MAG: hypothetical protein ACOX8S_03740 [Christensenellales bacterium]|jgi:hypothetical protein
MNKKTAAYVEVIFNMSYLVTAAIMGIVLLQSKGPAGVLPGAAALTLAGGDFFHLAPRIAAATSKDSGNERFHRALGLGKMITSVTMTVFYLILWHLGLKLGFGVSQGWTALAYALALLRIALCLFPQNGWISKSQPQSWAIRRNIPFALLGLLTAVLFAVYGGAFPGLRHMWLAIFLSFAFYAPVILWARKNPKLGMLMLPKTIAYIWMLSMLFSL